MNIGIYQSYWGRIGGGQRYIAVAAKILAELGNVEIVHHSKNFQPESVSEPLAVDLAKIGFRYVEVPASPTRQARFSQRLSAQRELGAEISKPYDVFIDSSDKPPYFCHAPTGVLLTHFPLITFSQFHGVFDSSVSGLVKKLVKRPFHRYEWKKRFAGYQHTIVNSDYTRDWIHRRWGRAAEILYPPLRESEATEAATKQKMILSISAFHSAQHKRHEDLIIAFDKLLQETGADWQLVMIGACADDEDSTNYVERLRKRAAGLPITILTNASGKDLSDALRRASVLWHSMGFGVDAAQHPELLEHFGMVVCEAMQNRVVPVVFDGGGLREIVSHEVDGFRWNSIDELCSFTAQLIENRDLVGEMGDRAHTSVQRYSAEAFRNRLLELFEPIVS